MQTQGCLYSSIIKMVWDYADALWQVPLHRFESFDEKLFGSDGARGYVTYLLAPQGAQEHRRH